MGQSEAGQDRAGRGRVGQGRAGQSGVGQGEVGWGRAKWGRAEWTRAEWAGGRGWGRSHELRIFRGSPHLEPQIPQALPPGPSLPPRPSPVN